MIFKNKIKSILLITTLLVVNIVSAQTNVGNRNASASCDSTCMSQATAVSQESNLQQRVIACSPGFSGTRLQTRVRQPDGNWGPWVDKDISQCNCAPTYEISTTVCPDNQNGNIQNRRDWTCTSAQAGVWGNWYQSSNTCAPLTRQKTVPVYYSDQNSVPITESNMYTYAVIQETYNSSGKAVVNIISFEKPLPDAAGAVRNTGIIYSGKMSFENAQYVVVSNRSWGS